MTSTNREIAKKILHELELNICCIVEGALENESKYLDCVTEVLNEHTPEDCNCDCELCSMSKH